jgi:transcriptional regulator with XRE-family HTH domain
MTTKIAKHLHQRLAELNMRPADLAKAIGVPRATVGQWVNGEVNPRWENLQKISAALDVDFFWLIVGKDSHLPDKLTKISKPDVSKRIRERKLELHLTVKDLEAMTMSSNSTVNQWLRGDTYPSLEKVELLATTLICSKEWLLFGVGERPMIPEEILKIEAFPDLPDLPERIKHRLNFLGLNL